jgi:hypothetical protein
MPSQAIKRRKIRCNASLKNTWVKPLTRNSKPRKAYSEIH